MHRRLLLGFALAAAAPAAGCGSSSRPQLTVSAASSLTAPFGQYAARDFAGADIHQSFGGSDELAAQIGEGAKPDVFASADTHYPRLLHRRGLVKKPFVFAGNRLVLAVPTGSPIRSLADVARPGVQVVVGDPKVPIGSYTREVLDRLPATEREAILRNVRSEEPDVASIVGKLTQGAADAGFTYLTDVRATGGELHAVRLPGSLQPDVSYAVAVVSGAPDAALARRFVAGLRPGGAGAGILAADGFLPAP
jgi:molybdate transport system substrate-binding protein